MSGGNSHAAEEHPVHDTQIKQLRHLDFFQHECFLGKRQFQRPFDEGVKIDAYLESLRTLLSEHG